MDKSTKSSKEKLFEIFANFIETTSYLEIKINELDSLREDEFKWTQIRWKNVKKYRQNLKNLNMFKIYLKMQ